MNPVLAVVFLTVFLDLVGFGLIIPVSPFFAKTLGADPTTITLLGASYSLMQFLFAPFWGRLSDRVGRRPVMLLSIAITATGHLCFAFSGNLLMLFAARMLAGFGSGNVGTAQAVIADSTTPENRSKGMGLIGAAFGLGFILGPALGGLTVRWGLNTPMLIAAGLSTLNLILAAFLLPETYPPEKRGTTPPRISPWRTLSEAVQRPSAGTIFILFFGYTTAFSLMEQCLALFIEQGWMPFDLAPADRARGAAEYTSYVLIMVGVTATAIQGGLIGPLVRRFGEKKLVVIGIVVQALALYGIPLAGKAASFPLLMGACFLLAAGSGITNPSLMGLLSRAVGAHEQGGALGLAQSFAALGRVAGPAVAGWFFTQAPELPFQVAGTLMLICWFLSMTVRSP